MRTCFFCVFCAGDEPSRAGYTRAMLPVLPVLLSLACSSAISEGVRGRDLVQTDTGNDCDPRFDGEGDPAWFVDADGDGHGDPSTGVAACDPPAGHVATSDDCNDSDAAINPSAVEVCHDGVD
ncbi:MAG: hypothetical protein FJ102_09955, partial [Deltaproteobacteria bacterium]|nr:hypothetical protein [Deltaproteobacteria bacterium]